MTNHPEQCQGVWVFVEIWEGRAARVSQELIGKGRELADKLQVNLTAMVIGESVRKIAEEMIQMGADRVLLADDPRLNHYNTDVYTRIIYQEAVREKPEVLVIGATPLGRDLAPRLARRLNTGCTADCTELDIDVENRLFVSTRPAFGGNVMATIICPNHRPQMATVRPGVMALPCPDESRSGKIEAIEFSPTPEDNRVMVLETVRSTAEAANIQEADTLVAIGMGASCKENFDRISELAQILGGQVAATRLAVEAGWISHDCQIGQTGKTVKPSLYIGCGVSGAVQHTAGMSGAKVIVAINKDRNATLFNFADYGIVGDVNEVVPLLIKELKRLKGAVDCVDPSIHAEASSTTMA